MISKSGKSRKSNSRRSLGVIGCHPGCWDAYHKARAAGTSSRQIRPIPWRQPGCFIPTILQQRSFERDQGARAGENYGNLADANAWRRSELACAGRTSVDRTCLTGLTHEARTEVRVTLTRQHQLCRRKSVQALPPQVFPRAPDLRGFYWWMAFLFIAPSLSGGEVTYVSRSAKRRLSEEPIQHSFRRQSLRRDRRAAARGRDRSVLERPHQIRI